MNKLNHLAIIADGNGRWAEKRGLPRKEGHDAGLRKLEEIVYWCRTLDITMLSVYVFSTENWSRPQDEITALGELAEKYFPKYKEFAENDIKVVISGCADNLKPSALEKIETIQRETAHCTGHVLNLCANYGGRREIVDAIAKGARTEEEITQALYHQLPPPDLILRTGGHQRLSNFMLWQSAYAELAFTHTLFPDLSFGELKLVKSNFEQETRKFGGIVVDKR